MTIGFVAFHYPKPEHVDEFVVRTQQVRSTLSAQAGCLDADVWVTPDGDAVVTTGRFVSEAAYRAAFGAAQGLGDVVAFDDRERKPRQIVTLMSPQVS
ncbi:antibiotic biosynthesis monooxygenase [Actinopolymorpha alba]|uniref:antibiotic biosynthesis monooxygenase n=1 Tax=Actinopolymorpha alba TaxID=533267 RepID=UPI00037A76BE|nr:antibiotic biosynthesis monooxygenase [Actinopolymorpha alba]